MRFKEQVPHVFVYGDHRPTYLSVFPPSARIRAFALPWKKYGIETDHRLQVGGNNDLFTCHHLSSGYVHSAQKQGLGVLWPVADQNTGPAPPAGETVPEHLPGFPAIRDSGNRWAVRVAQTVTPTPIRSTLYL